MTAEAIGGIAGGVGSLISSINQIFTGAKNRKMAKKINPMQVFYQANPLAQTNLSEALNARNGRMSGAGSLQNNIFRNQANATAGLNRNASDGSQALAMLGGLQGNSNDAFSDLQMREAMNRDYQNQFVAQARQGVMGEQQLEFQDAVRRYQGDMATKNALMGIGQTNQQNGLNSLASTFVAAGNGAFGNFGLGGGGGNNWQPARAGFNSTGRATGVF